MIIQNFILFFIVFSTVQSQNCSSYYDCQLFLYENITKNARSSLRPIESINQTITVNLGLSLIKLVSINEEESLFTIRAHLNETWNATIFNWQPSKFFNVEHIRVPAHSVWTPKIELMNPSVTTDFEKNQFIEIHSSGLFDFSSSTLMTIPCVFDLQYFPFDRQTCTFRIGSRIYDRTEVSIKQGVEWVLDDGKLAVNDFVFLSHMVDSNTTFFAGYNQDYDYLTVQITIQRRPNYLLKLISWPGFFLMLLTLMIFRLPPPAIERLMICSTLLICQFILLIIFAFHLPKRRGLTWPWMGRMILYDIFATSVLLVFCIVIRLVTDTNHYSSRGLPPKVRSLVFTYLARFVGLKRSSYATLMANRDSEYDVNDVQGTDSVMEPLTSVSNPNGSSSASDLSMIASSTIARDIGSIKQKFQTLIHERNLHREWLLLSHILNRLFFLVYLLFFSVAIGHHLFYQ